MTTVNTYMNVNPESLTDRDVRVALLNVAEQHAREYAGQSASGHAHADIHALGCLQGAGRFMHKAFIKPIKIDGVVHASAHESRESGDTETKTFIH